MKRICALAFTLVLALPVVHADTLELRIGAGHPANTTWISSIREFFIPRLTQRVKAETGHDIRWTEAWGGSVCKLGQCLDAVEAGLLDMADVQTPFEPSKLMAQNFTYFAPFGPGDPYVGAKAAWRTYQEVAELKRMLEDRYKQVFVGSGVIGNYGLITNFTWDRVDELKNHRIAAAGPNIPWVQAVGVVPVQSNLNEAYVSMQSGVYEGWVMFPDGVTTFKLEEVSKQFTITGFGVIASPLLTLNKRTWERLPPGVRKIVLEVGQEWNDNVGKLTAERQNEALQKMRAAGVRVKELSPAERVAWAQRLPNIPKQRAQEIASHGQPVAIYQYINALKAAGYAFPRDWAAER